MRHGRVGAVPHRGGVAACGRRDAFREERARVRDGDAQAGHLERGGQDPREPVAAPWVPGEQRRFEQQPTLGVLVGSPRRIEGPRVVREERPVRVEGRSWEVGERHGQVEIHRLGEGIGHRSLQELGGRSVEEGAALRAVGEPVEVRLVREVGLVRARARDPLPRQRVGGQIAVEQVEEEPGCTGTPVGARHVTGDAGEPHARVVVDVAVVHQRPDGVVERIDPRVPVGDRSGQAARVGSGAPARLWTEPIREDRAPFVFVDEPEELAPGEFLRELPGSVRRDDRQDVGNAHQSVRQVGGETRHRAAQMVPRPRVRGAVDRVRPLERSRARRRERGGEVRP